MAGFMRFQPCSACCGGSPCSVCSGGDGPVTFAVTFAGVTDRPVGPASEVYHYEWYNQTHKLPFVEESFGSIRIPTLVATSSYCKWANAMCGWGTSQVEVVVATNDVWWRLGVYPTGSTACIFLKEWGENPACADLSNYEIPRNSAFDTSEIWGAATCHVSASTGAGSPSGIQECFCLKGSSPNAPRFLKGTVAGCPDESGYNGEYVLENTGYLGGSLFVGHWMDDVVAPSLTLEVKRQEGGDLNYMTAVLNPVVGSFSSSYRKTIDPYPNCFAFNDTLPLLVDNDMVYDLTGSTVTIESL